MEDRIQRTHTEAWTSTEGTFLYSDQDGKGHEPPEIRAAAMRKGRRAGISLGCAKSLLSWF
jgi:hypothetical protein